MKMKHQKSLERLEKVFAAFMTAGALMCCLLLPLSNTVGAGKEVKERAKEEKEQEIAAEAMKDTVMGDIYDRNGVPVVTVEKKGAQAEYRHDEAYSLTLGFREENGSHLLMKNYGQDLMYSDGDTDKGRSLTLTLDSRLQEYAYDLISKGEGERGSITVLDAKSGEILAMAFTPSFSILEMRRLCSQDESGTPWNALVFGEMIPTEEVSNPPTPYSEPLSAPERPGSIYKIVTSIGILEKGLDQVVIDDEGEYKEGDLDIHNTNSSANGPVNYLSGFTKSSNIYFGRMAYEYLGWDTFRDISQRCKVGSIQSYDFGTVQSTYTNLENPYDESASNDTLAKAAFGYADLQLTGIHAAMITQGIANGGVMCTPYMVQSVNKTIGNQVDDGIYHYEIGEQVDSNSYGSGKKERITITNQEVAKKIKEAMVSAYQHTEAGKRLEDTSEEGLTINGRVYPIALKTGTADVDDNGNNNIWMVSFAPVDNPRYVVAVNRNRVKKGQFGADLFEDTISMYRMLFGNE